MTHRLQGARLKLARAQEHLRVFNDQVGRYIRARPYKIDSKIERNQISVGGVITAEPDASLACIVGDVVTNLRASLDYIAWELAMLAGRPLTAGQEKSIAFPLTTDKTRMLATNGTAHFLENTCGVPRTTINTIESVQPYNPGYEVLGDLDLLVKIDKHRTLVLCSGFVEDVGKIAIYVDGKLVSTQNGTTGFTAYIAKFGVTDTDYRVEFKEDPLILVVFNDIQPPSNSRDVMILGQIIKCVESVIARFEPLLT